MIRWATVRCAVCLCRLVHTYDQVSHCQVCCVSLQASHTYDQVSHCQACFVSLQASAHLWSGESLSGVLCVSDQMQSCSQASFCLFPWLSIIAATGKVYLRDWSAETALCAEIDVALCHCRLVTPIIRWTTVRCAMCHCRLAHTYDQVSHCQVCCVSLKAAHLWSGEPLSGVLCVTEGCTPMIRWATVRRALCHCRLVHTCDQVSHCQVCCVSVIKCRAAARLAFVCFHGCLSLQQQGKCISGTDLLRQRCVLR